MQQILCREPCACQRMMPEYTSMLFHGEHSGDHNHQDFPKSTAIQMGGVLQYKWEAYCDTNGRSTDSISLFSERRGTKSTAVQMGGVLQYKWEAYCDTFLKSSGGFLTFF